MHVHRGSTMAGMLARSDFQFTAFSKPENCRDDNTTHGRLLNLADLLRHHL
jgi:hypothetical protein